MLRADLIDNYLSKLAAELSFDERLARRVCDEVADHLWETMDAISSDNTPEAQRQAIASVGSVHDVAAQYLPLSLFAQARRVGGYGMLAIAGIVIGMKGCNAWYKITQVAVSPDLQTFDHIGTLIDRSASLFALITGIIGWAYITFGEVPIRIGGRAVSAIMSSFPPTAAATGMTAGPAQEATSAGASQRGGGALAQNFPGAMRSRG
jgi:hypothetical protein